MRVVQVLGVGCDKCSRLYDNALAAVRQAGVEAVVEKVADMDQITSYGVMMTPALVIDDQVKVVGKVPTADEIARLLAGE